MTREIQIGSTIYEVEDRKPKVGETYLGLGGFWKIADRNFDYLIVPVLMRSRLCAE